MILSFLLYIIICFFIYKNVKRAMILCLIWYPTICLFNIGPINIFSFVVVTLYATQYWNLKKIKKVYPFRIGLTICLFSYFVSNFFTIGGQHNANLINTFCLYGFTYILWKLYSGRRPINTFFVKHLIIYLIVLMVYATIEMILKKNFFMEYLFNNGIVDVLPVKGNQRYGVFKPQSLTIWSEVFGMICGLGFTTILIAVRKSILKLGLGTYILLFFLFLFIIFCGSRAVLVGSIICFGAGAFYYIKNIKYIGLAALSILLIVFFGGDFISQVIDGVIHHEEAGGSSLEMRKMQFATSVRYFLNHPFIGNGLSYIYTTVMKIDKSGIYGAESLLFELLVDRGLLGLASLLLLVGQTILFLFKSGMKYLSFIVLGFIFTKFMTLMASLDEMFFLYYVIPLYYMQLSSSRYRLLRVGMIKLYIQLSLYRYRLLRGRMIK